MSSCRSPKRKGKCPKNKSQEFTLPNSRKKCCRKPSPVAQISKRKHVSVSEAAKIYRKQKRSRSRSRSASPKSRSYKKRSPRARSPRSRDSAEYDRLLRLLREEPEYAEKVSKMEYERARCLGLPESMCAGDPNCHWTSGYRSKTGRKVAGHCGARPGVRSKGERFAGPLPESFYKSEKSEIASLSEPPAPPRFSQKLDSMGRTVCEEDKKGLYDSREDCESELAPPPPKRYSKKLRFMGRNICEEDPVGIFDSREECEKSPL